MAFSSLVSRIIWPELPLDLSAFHLPTFAQPLPLAFLKGSERVVRSFLLYGLPSRKIEEGSYSWIEKMTALSLRIFASFWEPECFYLFFELKRRISLIRTKVPLDLQESRRLGFPEEVKEGGMVSETAILNQRFAQRERKRAFVDLLQLGASLCLSIGGITALLKRHFPDLGAVAEVIPETTIDEVKKIFHLKDHSWTLYSFIRPRLSMIVHGCLIIATVSKEKKMGAAAEKLSKLFLAALLLGHIAPWIEEGCDLSSIDQEECVDQVTRTLIYGAFGSCMVLSSEWSSFPKEMVRAVGEIMALTSRARLFAMGIRTLVDVRELCARGMITMDHLLLQLLLSEGIDQK